jgi:hypothetical protein
MYNISCYGIYKKGRHFPYPQWIHSLGEIKEMHNIIVAYIMVYMIKNIQNTTKVRKGIKGKKDQEQRQF